MRDAGFGWVFVGIESPDPQTLKDTRKTQNTAQDVLESVRGIYAYGIDVLAGFIVGFDNDTLESFDHQYRFIMRSGIQAAMVGLLTALPKTPLYQRLEKEGRLRSESHGSDNTKLATNVVPKHLGYEQMINAYKRLYRRLLTDRAIAERIRNKLAHLGNPVYQGEYPLWQRIGIVTRLIVRGVLPGGPSRLYHFLRTIPWTAPRKLPLMIVDWIAGLAMRDYVQRHFEYASSRVQPAIRRRFAAVRATIADHVRARRVSLALHEDRVDITLALDARVGRRFFARLSRRLDKLLRLQGVTLKVCVEGLLTREIEHFETMLGRLSRHGDRVSIVIGERMQQLIRIDSSRFNLVLKSAAS